MPERLPRFERLKPGMAKAAKRVGAIALAAVTTVSCRYAPEAQPVPTPKQLTDCLLNGRPGDPDPTLLIKGEAVSIFPGTVEFQKSGDIIVQPIIQLGEAGVGAALELVFDAEADGFRLTALDEDELKTARWKLDSSKGTPGKPGEMTEKDECTPSTVTGRVQIHAQYVIHEDTAKTPLSDKPYPGAHDITVPLSRPDKNDYVAIGQWPKNDVFGVRLAEVEAQKYRTGTPIFEVVVPIR
ncbi:MAG TPA: hypothetical protein VFZ58_04005 [Candidatus Saccharimonadales bacterium]